MDKEFQPRIDHELAVALARLAAFCACADSQTVGEFWPALDAHVEFPHGWRLLAFVGLKKGEQFAYQRLNAGVGFGYQWRTIIQPHLVNIDAEKEHIFACYSP